MIKTLFLPQNKKQPLLLAGRVQLSLQYTKVCRLLLENRIEPLLLTYTPKQKKITPTDLLNAYMKVESYRIVSTFFCFLNACGILNENRYTSDSVLCSAAQLFYVLTHLRFSSAFNTTALMYITAYSMQNDTTMLVYCFVLNKRKHVFILCPVSTKQVPDSAKALYYNAA